jgi:hypothetical protein
MGSRLFPFVLVAGALVADAGGAHRPAYYLLLLAVPAAAAAAFVGMADVLEGKPTSLAGGVTASLSLLLLVAGCAARSGAPAGGTVPAIAVSAAVAALVVYAVPLVGWLLEPVKPRRRAPVRAHGAHRRAETPAARAAEAA